MSLHPRSQFATAQSGGSVPDSARSGAFRAVIPLGRKEDLRGGTFGHWAVLESRPRGYWQGKCCACGCEREIRLDASQTHIPCCRVCGTRSTDVLLKDERARHFARAKTLPLKV